MVRFYKSFTILAAAAILTVGAALAATSETFPVLTLVNGHVIRDVQIKGYFATTVLIRHDGLAETLPYSMFPVDCRAALLARRPQTHDRSGPAPVIVGMPGIVEPNALRHGCSFCIGTIGTVIPLIISNESEISVAVCPDMFVARTHLQEVLPGVEWVELDENGHVSVILKRHQTIDPGCVRTLLLMPDTIPHDGLVQTVRWRD